MNINIIYVLGGITILWLMASTFIGCTYLDKRNDFFEKDHIYIGDIFIGLICLPITLLYLIYIFIDKLIHIKIK